MKILINAPFSKENRLALLSAGKSFEETDNIELADIIIGDIPVEYFGKLDNLKWLQLASAGADRIIYNNAISDKTVLTNSSGAFGEVISEYVIGGILCLFRDFFSYRENQLEKRWHDTKQERMIFGSTALILGCGNIGKCVSTRLRAFGAKTVGVRQSSEKCSEFDETYSVETLDSLLPNADIIVCALPRTPKTEHLLNRERLMLIKNSAVIVNVGRGNVIDTNALCGKLKRGELFGAVLDVFENEPLEDTSPLWDMKNVFVTPHISGKSFGHSERTEMLIAKICEENLRRFADRKPLINVVQGNYET